MNTDFTDKGGEKSVQGEKIVSARDGWGNKSAIWKSRLHPGAHQQKVRLLFVVLLCVGGGMLLVLDIPPVMLSWETASEVGTAGFNVYRAAAPDLGFVQANPTLIAARGDEVTGATYRFADDDVTPARKYIYRIEEVEWDGRGVMYPETVTVRAGLPRLWTKIEGALLLLAGWAVLRRGSRESV